MKPINFRFYTNLKFGEGMSEGLGNMLVEHGFKRAGFIVDSGVLKTEPVKKIIESIEESCEYVKLFENKVAEPDYDFLDQSKMFFMDEKLDCLVAVGGGSTMDLAKGLATLVTNPGPAIEYRGFPKLGNRPLPVIAVPTTAGSGSDATYNAVFTDRKEKKRLGINSFDNFPILAILDPLLTASCPTKVAMSSGMDALTHALEAWVAKGANPVTRAYTFAAFPLVFHGLKKINKSPQDIEARGELLLGAYLAGAGLMQAGAGPAGAMSYPFGVHFNIPHGLGSGLLLGKVVEFNVKNGYVGYAKLYDAMEGADLSLDQKEKNLRFAQEILKLSKEVGIPTLGEAGIKSGDIDMLVEELFTLLKGAVDMNPVEMTRDDLKKIMKSLL